MKWALNILWSDPIEDDDDLVTDENGQGQVFRNTAGVHDSPRKEQAVQFGWDVTKTFCARNGLGLIIRSHQCKPDGAGFDIMHDDHLIRVFSARDYEGNGNDSATVLIRNTASDQDVRNDNLQPLQRRRVDLSVRLHGLASHTKDEEASDRRAMTQPMVSSGSSSDGSSVSSGDSQVPSGRSRSSEKGKKLST